MGKYIIKRLLMAIPTLIGISVIVFLIIHFVPGDPIQLMFGKAPDPVQIQYLRHLYGLDKPLYLQYFIWINNVLHGRLGHSIQLGIPVTNLIMERFPRTIFLCLTGIIISVCISFPTGIIAAWKHNKWQDLTISTICLILISVPSFWLGILLIIVFAVYFHLLPAIGYISPSVNFLEFIKHMILPSITLGASLAAVSARVLRVSLLEVLSQDYIVLARSKGCPEKRVLFIHALRNALIPTITVVGMQSGYLLGGAIVIERVFAYPGMGLLLVRSVFERDYPLVQAIILIFAVTFVVVNLITDIIYVFIDPKIRYR